MARRDTYMVSPDQLTEAIRVIHVAANYDKTLEPASQALSERGRELIQKTPEFQKRNSDEAAPWEIPEIGSLPQQSRGARSSD